MAATTTRPHAPGLDPANGTNGGIGTTRGALSDPATGTGKTARHSRRGFRNSGVDQPRTNRMTFGQWARASFLDILTMAAMGAVALGVFHAGPAPSRNFPVNFSDGQIVYPQMAYPLRNEIIPVWLAAFLSFIVPFLVFVLAQSRVRSFQDLNAATFGLLWALITAALFQVFIKWLIGGLRPHFLAACQPSIPSGVVGSGFQSLMFNRNICTGPKGLVSDSLRSMPSPHSTASWAGFTFLSLYLNAKLKFMANYRPAYWKMLLCFAPLLGAFLISSTPTIDRYHHWYDILVGGIIGTICAFAAYRASYAAIFDFRFNHIALPTGVSSHREDHGHGGFMYDQPSVAQSPVRTFTRKAGWGEGGGGEYGGELGGAPGDAAYGGVGAGSGLGATTGRGIGHGGGLGATTATGMPVGEGKTMGRRDADII